MLQINQKNTGCVEIIPIGGQFAGRVIATAEKVRIASGNIHACTLSAVWGLQLKVDLRFDRSLLRDLSLLRSITVARRR